MRMSLGDVAQLRNRFSEEELALERLSLNAHFPFFLKAAPTKNGR